MPGLVETRTMRGAPAKLMPGAEAKSRARVVPLKPLTLERFAHLISVADAGIFASAAQQVEGLTASLNIKNLEEVREQLLVYFYHDGKDVDFPKFAEALRAYVGKYQGKEKVVINKAVIFKLANPDVQPKEGAENAWMFAHPKEVAAAYLDPQGDDYTVLDVAPKVRQCFLGKIKPNDNVLIISFGDGGLEADIAKRTSGRVVVVNPIGENARKTRAKGLKILSGNPNDLEAVLEKARISGTFDKVVIAEALGELDISTIFSKVKKYLNPVQESRGQTFDSGRLLVATYLPAESPDYCGYERMSVATLQAVAERQGLVVDINSQRIFEVYEDRGEAVLVSEVSNPTLSDGFVYLEFIPIEASQPKGFSRVVSKNILFERETYVYTPHGSMGVGIRADGSFVCPTQFNEVFLTNPQGEIIAVFDGRRLHSPDHLMKRDYLDGRKADWVRDVAKREKTGGVEINTEQAAGNLNFPDGVCVDREGNIYLAAHYAGNVVVFDKDLKYLRTMKTWVKHGGMCFNRHTEEFYFIDHEGHGKQLSVCNKAGEEREDINEIDGIKFNNITALAFGQEGNLYVAHHLGIYVFSAERKLIREIKFPQRIQVMGMDVNSRGELFIGADGFSTDSRIIGFSPTGEVIANSAVNNGEQWESGFSTGSIRTLDMLDDNTIVICCQYESKVKVFKVTNQNYGQLLMQQLPASATKLREKIGQLMRQSLGYQQNEDVIMASLYKLLIRGDSPEKIEAVVDLLINHKDEILADTATNLKLFTDVFSGFKDYSQMALRLYSELKIKPGEFILFLNMLDSYNTRSGGGAANDEADYAQLPKLWKLTKRILNSNLVFKAEIISQILLKGKDSGSVGVDLKISEVIGKLEKILALPLEKINLKKSDFRSLYLSLDQKWFSTEVYSALLKRYCGPGKLPFSIFSRLTDIFGPDKEILDLYLNIFREKKGTFVAGQDFEGALLERLLAFEPLKPDDPLADAKRDIFKMITRNLIWQRRQSQIFSLKGYLAISILFKQFDRYPKFVNKDILAMVSRVNIKAAYIEGELSAVIERINKIFAYRVMGIKINKLSPEEQALYRAREAYFETFVPLALSNAHKNPEVLPVLKLLFLAALKGELHQLRYDPDYYPAWLTEAFPVRAERELAEKYLFKRGLNALRQVLGPGQQELAEMWAFDDEEVVRVSKRDFADLTSAIANGAYAAGFAYLSADFREAQKVVGAMSPEQLLAQMNHLRSTAQDLRYAIKLIAEGQTAEEVDSKVKFLSTEFVFKIFEEGDEKKRIELLEAEYAKVVFRQNLYSAARLANELADKASGVAAKLGAFRKRIADLSTELGTHEEFLSEFDLAHPGQQTVEQFKKDLLEMMQKIEKNCPPALLTEKMVVMRVLSQMLDFATEFDLYLHTLVSKSNSLATRLLKVGEAHAVKGYIDNVGEIVFGANAHLTSFRVKDTSDPVDIMLALQGQCLDYRSGCNNNGLTDVMLNPSVKVNIVKGKNGEERVLANQMVILGQAVDAHGHAEAAIILDQTYGTWGTSRAYLITKIKRSLSKAKKMGIPLVIPRKLMEKVGCLPEVGKEQDPANGEKEQKEALATFRGAIEEDVPIHSFKSSKLGFRVFSGGAPRLYTDLGSASWWTAKDDRQQPFMETEPFDVVVVR